MRKKAPPITGRLGAASAVAAAGWIIGQALTTAGALPGWALLCIALVVGGASILTNGLIGRELARRKELQRDLQSASRIQRSLFPGTLPQIAGCEFAMACRMSREIGGDCVDAFALKDGRLAILVGDVSGKGIAAALVMSSVQAQFRSLAQVGLPLPQIAERIAQQLLDGASGRYITAVMIFLDVDAGHLEFLSAGHVPFVCLEPGIKALAIDSTGPPLGLLPEITRTVHCRALAPGATFVFVTDGVTERRLTADLEYGVDRLIAATEMTRHLPAREAVDAILDENDRLAGGTAADDDLTIVAVRTTALAARS